MSNHKSSSSPVKTAPASAQNQPAEAKGPAGGKGTAPAGQPGKAPPGKAQPGQAAKAVPAGGAPSTPPVVPPLFRKIDWVTFAVTTILIFIGYWWTLAPDLTLEDSGELAVGSMYAGVPHPPGYPVWTIYSWLFTVLLPVSNIAYRVAISSAVAGAFACGLIALMVSRGSSMMMEGIADLKMIERRWESAICIVSGFVAGLLMGFNGFMWSQAVIVEVYTLSVLSLTGVLVCLLRWIYAPHQYRYLYLAFFWYGICFNNHMSLLVIALGLEAAILAVQPRLGRDLFFWNTVIYIGGLVLREMGMMTVLQDNTPLLVIYHVIGILSAAAWVWLAVRTKIRGLELARDAAMIASLAYLGALVGTITHHAMVFYYPNSMSMKTPPFVLFNLLGLACVGAFVYLIQATRKMGKHWVSALICGGAWSLGALFYLYMPLASMSNPPLNWGYPRTVQGFFHAFTRGQYERIHPTTSLSRFIEQVGMYIEGAIEEFNLVYILIGLLVYLFYRRMQARERAWVTGLTSIYLFLSVFLLILLNPAPDRQSRDLNKVFFTASHVMIAMGAGYGLSLIGAFIATHYERARDWVLKGLLIATALAFLGVIGTYTHIHDYLIAPFDRLAERGGLFSLFSLFSWFFGLIPPYAEDPIVRFTVWFGLFLAVAAVLVIYVFRKRPHLEILLIVCGLMPVYPIFSHWSDNEQRGHMFGYWFGHDMFTPSFKNEKGQWSYDAEERKRLLAQGKLIYPEMDRDTVLFGGTDPGRFNPTYMIYCESFIPPSKKPHDPAFDRRDVYLITQNALADGTYLNYIRAHYNRGAQIDPYFFSELLRGPMEQQLNTQTNILARMMLPLDRFFFNLGDRIEKKRRAGSSFFKGKDFLDLASFTAKLRGQGDPLSKYLFANLSKNTQGLLTGGGNDEALRRGLARDFNALLERGPLYDTNRFEGVRLSTTTLAFIRENPQSHTRIRLNRLLLEEAYPKEIAKSLGGVYPDREIRNPSVEDSQRAFQEYLGDAQRRLDHDRRFPNEPRQIKPGEDVRIIENKVQVSGQVAVMAINGLLTKIIFDANPDHEFYVEESFPLDWMYPHLTPFGIIMKINRNPLPELSEEIVQRDHLFWSEFSERLVGNWITYDTPISNLCAFAEKVYLNRNYKGFTGDPKFVRDNDGQKAFSKLRSSIAGVYAWRVATAKTPAEQQRMFKEAEFSFKQAYAFCPYSPEAIFRYINLLISVGRVDDALLMARTSKKLDPFNAQLDNLVFELQRIKQQQAAAIQAQAESVSGAQIAQLEQQLRANPSDAQVASRLISAYIQGQQHERAQQLVDQIVASPNADANMLLYAAQVYHQLNRMPKVEDTLAKLVQIAPDNPEAWFDLAGIQAMYNKDTQALASLSESLQRSALRLARDSNANNLYSNALTDPRFNALRQRPEFQSILENGKPPPK